MRYWRLYRICRQCIISQQTDDFIWCAVFPQINQFEHIKQFLRIFVLSQCWMFVYYHAVAPLYIRGLQGLCWFKIDLFAGGDRRAFCTIRIWEEYIRAGLYVRRDGCYCTVESQTCPLEWPPSDAPMDTTPHAGAGNWDIRAFAV